MKILWHRVAAALITVVVLGIVLGNRSELGWILGTPGRLASTHDSEERVIGFLVLGILAVGLVAVVRLLSRGGEK